MQHEPDLLDKLNEWALEASPWLMVAASFVTLFGLLLMSVQTP